MASRFHIERIVTSHDPRRISFSENTGIHECLIVVRRRQAAGCPPTVRDVEFLPMQEAERCEARRVIDEAAAAALDVNAEAVAVWRAMLAAEPTVTNRRVGTAE